MTLEKDTLKTEIIDKIKISDHRAIELTCDALRHDQATIEELNTLSAALDLPPITVKEDAQYIEQLVALKRKEIRIRSKIK